MSIALGNINAGELRAEFVRSLLRSRDSANGSPAVAESIIHTWGPYLDDGRNMVTQAFLEGSECDILLFVDSDISWTNDDIREIESAIHPEVSPVVGGLYYSGFSGVHQKLFGIAPVAYRWGTKDNNPSLVQLDEESLTDTDSNGLVKVAAIGTGFLGIHRDLLMQMGEWYGTPQPWFAEEDFYNVHHGEDFTFCLRLADHGVPVYLKPSVRVKHHKVVTL